MLDFEVLDINLALNRHYLRSLELSPRYAIVLFFFFKKKLLLLACVVVIHDAVFTSFFKSNTFISNARLKLAKNQADA